MLPSTSISRRDLWLWSLVIVGAALLLRLIHLSQFQSTLFFDNHVMDMKYHHDWAVSLSQGRNPIDGPFFRAPLYPYFVSLVYSVFGAGPWALRLIQALMGSFSALLVFLIGCRVFSLRVGIIAGLIMAGYGTLILYEAQILIPALVILLNLAAVYSLLRATSESSRLWYALSGLFLGLSAIARPTVLLFAVAVVIFLLWRAKRRTIALKPVHLLLFGLSLVGPIAPVTVYNYAVSGEFILIGTYTGLNFYIGNNKQSDGVSAKLPGERRDWWGMMEGSERIANEESGRTLSAAERSSFWIDKTIGEIRSDPIRWLGHLSRKCLLLIEGTELSNNFDLYYFAHQTSLLAALLWHKVLIFPYGLLLPLAVMGMLLVDRSRSGVQVLFLFIAAYVPSLILFFVSARYRLPLVPFFALFAAIGVVSIGKLMRSGVRKVVTVAAVVVGLLVLCNLDLSGHAPKNEAQGHYTTASIYGEQGRITQAEFHYARALAEDSTLAEAYNNLGLLLIDQGKHQQAIKLLERAVRFGDEYYLTRFNLAYAYSQAGRPGDGIGLLETVLASKPDFIDAAFNLALCYERTDQAEKAVEAYEKCLAADARSEKCRFNLANLLVRLGEGQRAGEHFQMFLSLPPEDGQAADYARQMLDSLGG